MRSTLATPSASPADSGITALIGGDAMAFGTTTVAAGEVTNIENVGGGGTTIAFGEAIFAAQGTSPSAHTSANVTGEDILFEVTINEHGGSGPTAWAGSETSFFAVDIPGWNPPGGPIVVDHVINAPAMPGMAGFGELLGSGQPGANVAHDTLTVEVTSPSPPLVIALSDALAVGGQFSAVSAWALVAA